MKTESSQSQARRTGRKQWWSRIRLGFKPARVPPHAQAIDPHGPDESMWPRGWFNFGNVVFAIGLAAIVLLLALAWPQFK